MRIVLSAAAGYIVNTSVECTQGRTTDDEVGTGHGQHSPDGSLVALEYVDALAVAPHAHSPMEAGSE